MDTIIEGIKQRIIQGNITVPGDKSITHRAIILGSIASGDTTIHNFLNSLDCKSTLKCMEDLGVQIRKISNSLLKIKGKGFYSLHTPQTVLDVGNSGTTIRLLSGLLSGHNFSTVIDGDDSIRKRPMKRIVQPLSLMNAQIRGLFHKDYAPLNIIGSRLMGINYTLPVASAQVKSAILLAGLYASGETVINEPDITRDHTERMLALMQANIQSLPNHKIRIRPVSNLQGVDIDVPGDISSAAYFLAAACAREGAELLIKNIGINPTRTGFIDVLNEMGAQIELLNQKEVSNEPRADIKIKGTSLKGIQIDKKRIAGVIDELPLIAVIATQARGKTLVKDARELRVKETDRIKAIVDGLTKLGAKIIEKNDGFEVSGLTELSGSRVHSYHDHRIAMSLSIAASYAKGKTVIQESQCMDVSYPKFMQSYKKIIR